MPDSTTQLETEMAAGTRHGNPKLKFYLSIAGAIIVVIAVAMTAMYFLGWGPFSGQVAARVNGDKITVAKLDARMDTFTAQNPTMLDTEQGGMDTVTMRQSMLESMIDDLLFEQEAAREGIKVTDEEVQEQLNLRIEAYPDQAAFEHDLKSSGYTIEIFESQIRADLILEALMEKKVSSDSVTDKDVQDYFQANTSSFLDEDGEVRPIEDLEPTIRMILAGKRRNTERDSLLQSLRDSATIKILDPTIVAANKAIEVE